MLAGQANLAFHMNKYYNDRTVPRKINVARTVRDVGKIVGCLLKEIELQEPRFISSLNDVDGRLEGLEVISPNEYEVILFLNQMGIFNFVDDGSIPGCAVLKLSDGRKRSMSLWVEFITASGYLSARKVRAKFQALMTQAVDKLNYSNVVEICSDNSEVKLKIRGRVMVRVTPAFKCSGIWPRSASHWPDTSIQWPAQSQVNCVKTEGFNLLSKDSITGKESQSNAESDAWVMSFREAEDRLVQGTRRKCLSILKTMRDQHLGFSTSPINGYHLKTLLLYECEKHPHEQDWDNSTIGDRIQGILLQLVSCLRCRRLPHYFLPNVDLFACIQPQALDSTARQVWCLTREIITNCKSLDRL